MNRRIVYTLFFIIFLFGPVASARPSGLRGTVKDDAGRPVPGVVMSDGFSCVQTAADGRWYIEKAHPEARFVSCSYPADAVIPIVGDRPCIYRKISKGQRTYDFVLTRQEKEKDFSIICIGDPQVKEETRGMDRFSNETVADIRDFAAKSKGRHIYAFTLGDHAHNQWWLLPEMSSRLGTSKLGIPCFSVIGNHDHQPKETDAEARKSYEDAFGPVNYSLNRGDVHLVMMDNILFKAGRMKETLTEDDYNWLRNDLSFVDEGKTVIVLTHATMSDKGQPELYRILSKFSEARLISGHSHSVFKYIRNINGKEIYQDVVGTANGVDWAGTVCGDGAPMGYAVYDFKDGHIVNNFYKPVRYDASFQIRMYRSSDFPSLSRPLKDNKIRTFDWNRTEGSVILNIWNYNPKWKLSVYENGVLSDVEIHRDNTMNDLWACNYYYIVKNRWTGSYCQRRNHLFWFVPKDKDARILVKATDEYGNEYVQDSFTKTVDSAGTYEAELPSLIKKHPYLFISDEAMSDIKAKVQAGDEATSLMHGLCIGMADEALAAPELQYQLDESGKRLLLVSRRALKQISACAYAWRFTGKTVYLEKALKDLESVCSFPDWNPSHFLDTAEMATAVSIGYDWLFAVLPDALKKRIEEIIPEYVFKPALAPHPYFNYTHNWNEVCNAGTLIAALTIYPKDHPFVLPFLDKAVISNRKALKMYAPDGVYSEGPVYWIYGTAYEVLLISALNDTIDTDYALYEQKGFGKSPEFIRFASYGAVGQGFNFSDNIASEYAYVPLWYFAWREHKPSMIKRELQLLRENHYLNRESERFLPMMMRFVAGLDWAAKEDAAPVYFAGNGRNPVIMVHTDWTYSATDRFLGIKGGFAGAPHGHMDAGEFVYDAYGCRWSMDISREEYAPLENAMKEVNGNLWDMTQGSMRWNILRYNNRFHSTLTINDADHKVDGKAVITERINDGSAKGGTLDLSPVFAGEASKVVRTVRLVDGRYLEIADTVTALDDKPAKVHWNMTTPASVNISGNGIKLTQKGKTLTLKTVSDAVPVKYAEWPVDPKEYNTPLAGYETKAEGVSLCGFEAEVPAGKTAVFITTLK